MSELTRQNVLDELLPKHPNLKEEDVFDGKYLKPLAKQLLHIYQAVSDSHHYRVSRREYENFREIVVYDNDMTNPVNALKLEKFLQNNDKCSFFYVRNYTNFIRSYTSDWIGFIGIPDEAREMAKNKRYVTEQEIEKFIKEPQNTSTFYIFGNPFSHIDGLNLDDIKSVKLIENIINK